MKTILTLFSLVFALACAAQLPPYQRNPWTTNVQPTNPSAWGNVTIQEAGGAQALSFGSDWTFYNSGQQLSIEWPDNGTIPFYIPPGGSYVAMPLGFRVATNAGVGKVLGSDSVGNATWQSLESIPSAGFPLSGWLVEDFNAYSPGPITAFTLGTGWRQNGALLASSALITNVTLPNGESRNVLRLTRGDYVRPMPWGTNWVSLRIGIIASIQGSAVTNNFTNNAALGICVETNAPYGFSTTTGFLGVHTAAGSGVQRYSNMVSGFNFVETFSTLQNFVFKTNESFTAMNTSGSGSAGRAFGADQHYTAWIVELNRPTTGALNPLTSTNFTARSRRPSYLISDAVPFSRVTRMDNLVADMILQSQNANTFTAMAGNNLGSTSINDGLNGERLLRLDTINLFWNHPDVYVDIMAIVVFKAM